MPRRKQNTHDLRSYFV